MKMSVFFVLGLLVIFMPFVSAEILIGQPEELYNVGDNVKLDITLKPSTNSNGFLVVSLVCGEFREEIYKNSFSVATAEQKVVSIESGLTKSVIGSLSGDCYFEAAYSDEKKESQKFIITNSLEISLDLDGKVYDPGKEIFVVGEAIKANEELVNGFAEVKFDETNIKTSGVVSEGKFSFNFSIPKTASPGAHVLKVRVYELDNSGELSNEAEIVEEIRVREIVSELEIVVDSESVSSGDSLSYTINVYDQAENLIEKNVNYKILDPLNKVSVNEITPSGQTKSFQIGSNYSFGYWRIEASVENLVSKKLFYVEQNSEVSFELVENILKVVNIGNVPYKSPIEISIGENKKIVKTDIEVGKSKEYKLVAPDKDYEIVVNLGNSQNSLGTASLTGRAIDVNEVGGRFSGSNIMLAVLFVAIVVMAIVINRVIKKKSMKFIGKMTKNSKTNHVKSSTAKLTPISLSGKKEKASIVALKFNQAESEPALLSSLLNFAKNLGAKVYVDGMYRVVVFTQSLTKRQDNEMTAVRVAKEFEKAITEHNRKMKNKIDFGIGLVNGEFIVEMSGGDIKLTSAGSGVSSAKKLAHKSTGAILVSQSIKTTLGGALRTAKAGDAYQVTDISEREKHHGFIKGFLDKQDKDN